MKLKIKITKKILEESKMCGTKDCMGVVTKNCAIAVAVREIFPKASVQFSYIEPFGEFITSKSIYLPEEATAFIHEFDDLNAEQRVNLAEFEFEVDIPESVIEAIPLPDIEKIISTSETLELVE